MNVHGFGPDPQVEKFKEDLAAHIWFRDGGVHREDAEYEHLKRFCKGLSGAMTIDSNPKSLDAVLELLGLEGAKEVPTPSVPAHKEKLTTGELLSPAETTVYRQCVGGLLYCTQDGADAQYELSRVSCRLLHLNVDRFHRPCLLPGRTSRIGEDCHIRTTWRPLTLAGSTVLPPCGSLEVFATPSRRYYGRTLIRPSSSCTCQPNRKGVCTHAGSGPSRVRRRLFAACLGDTIPPGHSQSCSSIPSNCSSFLCRTC